jgi:UDP-N-acetyl-D-glucosamine dehydrogenase
MAVFCHELGIDLWQVVEAAETKPFGFQAFRPGPGVGGHCIPVDPSYLSWAVRRLGYPFRFVELAQEINARMPAYVATRLTRALNDRSRAVRGSRILLLGVTYKADVADARETPAVPLARNLLELGADVHWHDPFLHHWAPAGTALPRDPDPVQGAAAADVVVLLQPHRDYDLAAIASAASLLLDTRGVVQGERVERL